MSLFSRYVRFIFHVCSVLSLLVISLHLPSCRLVSCPVFPFYPCTPLVFISVPFMSLSVPLCFPLISRCFPVMSTSYFLPSFPCTSLHFPLAGNPSQKKEPAGGFEPGTPVLRRRLPEDYVSWNVIKLPRGTWGTPPPNPTYLTSGGGGRGEGYPLSSLKYPTRLHNVGGFEGCLLQLTGGILNFGLAANGSENHLQVASGSAPSSAERQADESGAGNV